MLTLQFHPDVSNELRSSYRWYQRQAEGLGDDFLNELVSAYSAILELPETWPLFQHGFRRYLLTRFPFSVIYKQHEDLIYVGLIGVRVKLNWKA